MIAFIFQIYLTNQHKNIRQLNMSLNQLFLEKGKLVSSLFLLKLLRSLCQPHFLQLRQISISKELSFIQNFHITPNLSSVIDEYICGLDKLVISFCELQFYFFIYRQIRNMNRSSTSPFRGGVSNIQRQPLPPGSGPESMQLLIRSLERQNTSLVEQVNILKQKSKKVNELQDKTELIVKHNDQLLRQNERLAKLINQKKNQVQVWKNKYETLTVNRASTNDLQNRKLINQIERLKEEITEVQHMKNIQISELKNQNHLEIQNIKRHHLSNNQKYQLQIRKLKEYCEKKEYQISDLNMKFVRLNKETDFQIGKLKEEKERLRSDLQYEQLEHKKEIDSLKSKFDYTFHSQVQNLKKQHLNQVQALDYENIKLKEVINSKNSQIQQILAKNLKVKNNYEDSIQLLKRENQDLKDKIFQTERIADIEMNNLRDKLEGIKQSELTLLKNAHSNQMDLLQRQIKKLQDIIEGRNAELQAIAKEKTQIRQYLQAEIVRAKAQLEAQIHQNQNQAAKFENDLKLCDLDLKSKNQELKTIQTYLQSQVNTLKGENGKLSELLDRKTDSLDKQREEHYKTKKTLQNELQVTKDKLANAEDDLERLSKRSNSELDDVKKINQLKVKQLQSKIKGLQQENNEKDNLINELRETIQLKENQIKLSNDKIGHLQKTERDLRRQAKQNLSRWQAKEDEYNRLIKNQTENMEKARKRELDELKNIQDNKINSLKHQIREYQRHIEDKNRVINSLKTQYQDLVNKFQQIFAQRAAQKNLDIKVPGWIPDTLATKNVFDIFLKNKVLQYCS